jgi:hypothetical protein
LQTKVERLETDAEPGGETTSFSSLVMPALRTDVCVKAVMGVVPILVVVVKCGGRARRWTRGRLPGVLRTTGFRSD